MVSKLDNKGGRFLCSPRMSGLAGVRKMRICYFLLTVRVGGPGLHYCADCEEGGVGAGRKTQTPMSDVDVGQFDGYVPCTVVP